MIPPDDDTVAEWVRQRLEELDTTPRRPTWRHRAVGMTKAQALAEVPRYGGLALNVPVAELRLVHDAARRVGCGPSTYMRRAMATVLVACEGYHPDAIPYFIDGGLIPVNREAFG